MTNDLRKPNDNNYRDFGMYSGEQVSTNHSGLGSPLFTTPPKANRKPHPNSLSFKDTRLRVILIKKGIFLKTVIAKKIPFFIRISAQRYCRENGQNICWGYYFSF